MLTITHKRSLLAIQAIIYLLWPTTLWAAQITISTSLASVPVAAWLMVFILSTVSSLAALLSKLKESTPSRLGIFVASHMLGSWLAGLLVFLVAEGIDWPDFFEVVAIALASYAGAQLMDRASAAFVNRTAGQLEQGAYESQAKRDK